MKIPVKAETKIKILSVDDMRLLICFRNLVCLLSNSMYKKCEIKLRIVAHDLSIPN